MLCTTDMHREQGNNLAGIQFTALVVWADTQHSLCRHARLCGRHTGWLQSALARLCGKQHVSNPGESPAPSSLPLEGIDMLAPEKCHRRLPSRGSRLQLWS